MWLGAPLVAASTSRVITEAVLRCGLRPAPWESKSKTRLPYEEFGEDAAGSGVETPCAELLERLMALTRPAPPADSATASDDVWLDGLVGTAGKGGCSSAKTGKSGGKRSGKKKGRK